MWNSERTSCHIPQNQSIYTQIVFVNKYWCVKYCFSVIRCVYMCTSILLRTRFCSIPDIFQRASKGFNLLTFKQTRWSFKHHVVILEGLVLYFLSRIPRRSVILWGPSASLFISLPLTPCCCVALYSITAAIHEPLQWATAAILLLFIAAQRDPPSLHLSLQAFYLHSFWP